MTNAEILAVQKADTALADLSGGSNGGLLNTEQSNIFFRKIIDQPTIVNEARTVSMSSPKREINKVGFGTRILRTGFESARDPRNLVVADRAKPTTGKVTLDTKEFLAEVRLPYEVLEDNVERQNFSDTVMELIAERVALDIEELVLLGDTNTVGDVYLASLDGVLKNVATNGATVNANGASISKTLFRDSNKAMPDRFLRQKQSMRFYTSVDNETQYRDTLADRQTGLGDSLITGMAPVYAFGTPVAPVALMPSDQILFLDPKNILVGFHREVMVETDKIIQERVYLIVVTLRMDVKIEESEATVLVQNVAAV